MHGAGGWRGGGLGQKQERTLISDLPRPISGYQVLYLGAMLPGHLLGSSRDREAKHSHSLNWSHSLGNPVKRTLRGRGKARNQSLQLHFLDSGLDLKQADLTANLPD